MTKKTNKIMRNRKIDRIHNEILAIKTIAQGTLSTRTKVCGKPNCRCANDPEARHGPYFEWTRRENGRYVHSVVSSEQAETLVQAIKNYKRVQLLLKEWSKETARLLKM